MEKPHPQQRKTRTWFITSHGQPPPRKSGSITPKGDLRRQAPSQWTSPSSFVLSFVCWAWHQVVWNIPLGPAVPAVSSPTPCLLPASSLGAVWGAERVSALCKPCSVITKISLFINTVSSTDAKHSPLLTTLKDINPSKTTKGFN